MPTYQINSGHVSRPRVLGIGQILTVIPDSGAYAIVEYTLGTLADVQNGVAEWLRSNRGDAITSNIYMFSAEAFFRASPVGGNATIVVDDQPSAASLAAYGSAVSQAMRTTPSLPARVALSEGQALTITGAAATTGTALRVDATGAILQSWAIAAGVLPQIGPFARTQKILITCTAGSIDATVQDAVVTLPKIVLASATAFAGDSLQGQSGPFTVVSPGVSVTITKPDIGWGGWMMRFAKGAINLVGNFAVIGYTTEQILATIPAVIASGATTVIVNGMTNDIVAGWPISRTKAALSAIYKMLRDAGIRVVMVTAPPLYKLTAVEGAKFVALNEWVKDQARDFGAPLIDIYSVVADPTSATGWAKSGSLLADNTHFTPKSARAAGQLAWATIGSLYQDKSVHAVSVLDLKSVNPDGTNLLSNALMTGTAGTGGNIGTIPANSVASGMQVVSTAVGPTVTPSLVARADGFGFDQIADVTAGVIVGSGLQIRTNDGAYTRANPGDMLQGEIWLAAQNMAGVFRIHVSLTSRIDGVLYQSTDASSSADSSVGSAQYDQSAFASMPFKTEPFQLPSTGVITSLNLTVDVYFSDANGTIKLSAGRPYVRKIN